MKNPLKFFEKEEIEITKHTVVKKGIAEYCCKQMKKACEELDTGKKDRYGCKNPIFAMSEIYNRQKNEIGLHTHSYINPADYDYHRSYCNYMKFKFCPFCGTKINGYVEVG